MLNRSLPFSLILINTLMFISSYGQQFSDASFGIFWESMDQIERQDETSIEDLEKLWRSPGYSSWMGSKRSQSIFYNYFTLVNDPKLQDSLQHELARSTGYRLILFKHFIEAKQKRTELHEFAEKIKTSDIIEQAKKHAFKYLPDTLSVEDDSTIIAMMIFQPDAFAIPEDNVVLMDVLFAYNYGEGFESFLGHELHHIYAGKYLSKLKTADYKNEALVWSIDKLRSEGIADLIDKEHILEKVNKSEHDQKYIDHYRNSKRHLQTIDSLLQEIAKDTLKFKELGKKVRRELPYSAHPMGLYIAKIIKNNRGPEALLHCLESPFPFLYLYNEIARESQGKYHVFSDLSIQYLQALEQKYINKE
ncbi:MAG: hypothetical protein MI974_26200 [Chitinophagales bacterium]|nr:hypothetical protein [Chitinophagales bacterium]